MKRRGRFDLPPVILDRDSSRPLYRQVQETFGCAIRSGVLPAGVKLPSTRFLARLLGVSRTTVLAAYDALAADDLIDGKVGSGTHVGHGRVMEDPRLARRRDLIRPPYTPTRAIWFADPDGNLLSLN